MKTCKECNQSFDLDNFYSYRPRPDAKLYYRSTCKSCYGRNTTRLAKELYHKDLEVAREKRRAYRQANREQTNRWKRKQNWKRQGIDVDVALELVNKNDGTCDICKRPPQNGKALYVDHCHTSGRVRGVICHDCNTGLSRFQDNPDNLRKAADYLDGN